MTHNTMFLVHNIMIQLHIANDPHSGLFFLKTLNAKNVFSFLEFGQFSLYVHFPNFNCNIL